eukprot:9481636-Pyramimonas_sp.AAC.1
MNYCNKLLAVAKTKPHIEAKHKKDPEMTMYKLLRSHIEGTTNSRSSTNNVTIEGEVDPTATEAAIETIGGLKRKAADDEEQESSAKKSKGLKLTQDALRFKKMQHDISHSQAIADQLEKADLRYTKEIITNLRGGAEQLTKLSHDMRANQLLDKPDKVDAIWAKACEISKSLVEDIDVGARRMNASSKPYSTPFDAAILSRALVCRGAVARGRAHFVLVATVASGWGQPQRHRPAA